MGFRKYLISMTLLGSLVNGQEGLYQAYSPGQYSHAAAALRAQAPRLVPVKVRASGSRVTPSYSYPYSHSLSAPPPRSPYLSPLAQTHSQPPPSSSSSYPRQYHQHHRLSGYYRPTRQYYSGYEHHQVQPLSYRAAPSLSASPSASPVVLKRGRVLAAPSPYAAASVQGFDAPATIQYTQAIPGVSTYRAPPPQAAPPPPQYQPNVVHQAQQPVYYVQKAPAPRLKVAKVKTVAQPLAEADPEEDEYPADPNPQYNFSFDIKDDELTNYQNRQEERDGQTIKGSYSVVDPDGYVRTVTYTADPKNGFQAKVTREPTDVKIKFPVPTEAPAEKVAGPTRAQAYQPQYHQPQYQSAAYATPQQTYAAQPAYSPASGGRFLVPSSTQPRLASRYQ